MNLLKGYPLVIEIDFWQHTQVENEIHIYPLTTALSEASHKWQTLRHWKPVLRANALALTFYRDWLNMIQWYHSKILVTTKSINLKTNSPGYAKQLFGDMANLLFLRTKQVWESAHSPDRFIYGSRWGCMGTTIITFRYAVLCAMAWNPSTYKDLISFTHEVLRSWRVFSPSYSLDDMQLCSSREQKECLSYK